MFHTHAGLIVAAILVAASCGSAESDAATTEPQVDFTRVTESLEVVAAPGIEKLHTISGIYFASQPDEAGFRAAREGGVKSILNLRHVDEIELDERALVEELGLTYLHLPWNGAEELTDEVFDRTRELLGSAEKPLLFHCKSANRVGAIWLPHRVLDGGVSVEDALAEAKTIGLSKQAYEDKALDYIQRKNP